MTQTKYFEDIFKSFENQVKKINEDQLNIG
jgi:hypothetical protein